MWITCQWVITVRVRPSTRVGWHNWTIKPSTVSLAHLALETRLCSWLGWLKSIRERKWIFYQVGLLAFDMMCMMRQVSVGNFQDNRYCMHVVHSTLFMGHSQGNRRPETIVRSQTNATQTHLHEGRMLRPTTRRWSACERQSRQKDVTNKPPASDSTSDRFWRQQTVPALLSLLSKSPCNGYSETKPYRPREGRRLVTLGLRKARFLQNTLVN